METLYTRYVTWCAGQLSSVADGAATGAKARTIGRFAGNRGLEGPVWLPGWSGRSHGAMDGAANGAVACDLVIKAWQCGVATAGAATIEMTCAMARGV